jgi:hypothetical protein
MNPTRDQIHSLTDTEKILINCYVSNEGRSTTIYLTMAMLCILLAINWVMINNYVGLESGIFLLGFILFSIAAIINESVIMSEINKKFFKVVKK